LASDPILDRKVQVLIKLRDYEILERERGKEGELITVRNSKGGKILVWAMANIDTIGIRYVNQLSKRVESMGLDGGIIVSNGKYTYSARSNARKKGVELIPPNFPSFNIFEHYLVPKHEILTPEEKEEVLQKYRVEPYKLPPIKTSDPVARVIGAKPGDLIKIVRKSPTAGEYVSYRYVVEG
jgi:DNA-directed RNA polymerase subunit H